MAKEVIDMPMKEYQCKRFGEVIGEVDGGINPLQKKEVPFDPITKRKIFNINVTGAWGGFLSVSHQSSSVVIFVCRCSCFLGNIEVP